MNWMRAEKKNSVMFFDICLHSTLDGLGRKSPLESTISSSIWIAGRRGEQKISVQSL